MNRVQIAQETLSIVEKGRYLAPSGSEVSVRETIDAAVQGTRLYRPKDLDALMSRLAPDGLAPPLSAVDRTPPPRIELTSETTAQAGRRLVEREGVHQVLALNFASARSPGGGFLGGAKAQEEDLARCSALYPCLTSQMEYYDVNRDFPTPLYTDAMIYSPAVPFFRDDFLGLLDAPFLLSILTAPAPNAGALAKHPGTVEQLPAIFEARIGRVLAVAAAEGYHTLILGAWGCGAFRNDPALVAGLFARWLAAPAFRSAFDRVVFAVYDPGGTNLGPFEKYFGPAQLI